MKFRPRPPRQPAVDASAIAEGKVRAAATAGLARAGGTMLRLPRRHKKRPRPEKC